MLIFRCVNRLYVPVVVFSIRIFFFYYMIIVVVFILIELKFSIKKKKKDIYNYFFDVGRAIGIFLYVIYIFLIIIIIIGCRSSKSSITTRPARNTQYPKGIRITVVILLLLFFLFLRRIPAYFLGIVPCIFCVRQTVVVPFRSLATSSRPIRP